MDRSTLVRDTAILPRMDVPLRKLVAENVLSAAASVPDTQLTTVLTLTSLCSSRLSASARQSVLDSFQSDADHNLIA